MSEAVGENTALHTTRTSFKIQLVCQGANNSGHFRVSTRKELQRYIGSRSMAKIVGPLTVSIKGPAAPDRATTGTVTITPHDLPAWPRSIHEVRQSPESVDVTSSLYLEQQAKSVVFHPAINTQIKPDPVVGRHPAIVYAYAVTGGAKEDIVTIEVDGVLELSGIDYVSPWTVPVT